MLRKHRSCPFSGHQVANFEQKLVPMKSGCLRTTLDCPADIDLLLWCHTRPDPHPHVDSGHYQVSLQQLVECGAIEPVAQSEGGGDKVYRTTRLGAAWVRALCLTPRPRQVFVDTAGVILE